MEDIFVIEHIKNLCNQRGWTYYKLAQKSNIPYSSLNTMLKKQHIPSMNNLIKICKGFDITLSQFFSGIEPSNDEQSMFLNLWNSLDEHSKELVLTYMYGLAHKEIPLLKPAVEDYLKKKGEIKMTYRELKKIVDKRLLMHQTSLPIDIFYVASQLNIRIKNSIGAKEDFKDSNPLYSHNTVYAINKGEYTIYYDEHYAYKNFSIAHEISHHLLGHTSDGAKQHQEAQLMACIIVAPVKLIHKHKIKSPLQLSEICKIPIDVAEDYWNEITKNGSRFYSLNKSNAIKIIVIILSLVMLSLSIYFNYTKRIDYTGYERNFEDTTYSPLQ